MSSIERGQVYVSANPRDEGRVRIRIKGWAPYGAGHWGAGKAQVVSLTESGKEVRPRSISLSALHDSPRTPDGRPRRTGYVLEQGR